MIPVSTLLAAATLAVAGIHASTAELQADPPQQSAVNANLDAARADGARDAGTQAQYQADLDAYRAALVQHDAQADATQEHYQHQQRAYADAMAAWRAQDYACRHGSSRACNAPAPDPSAYW